MTKAGNHFAPTDQSPKAQFYRAHDRIAERDQALMALLTHPTNPLTATDIERLVARDPARYGRYAGFAKIAIHGLGAKPRG